MGAPPRDAFEKIRAREFVEHLLGLINAERAQPQHAGIEDFRQRATEAEQDDGTHRRMANDADDQLDATWVLLFDQDSPAG